MARFAVIDTETNWSDQVMSIGIVIADGNTFSPLEIRYYVLPIPAQAGGMYEHTLFIQTPAEPILCSREKAIADIRNLFARHGVSTVMAYNAGFDRNHLPELRGFEWRDIMGLAAYRQHNPRIPPYADCCSTGRLRRGYGVEAMYRLLTGDQRYHESHNACLDALDELAIMKNLRHRAERYPRIG